MLGRTILLPDEDDEDCDAGDEAPPSKKRKRDTDKGKGKAKGNSKAKKTAKSKLDGKKLPPYWGVVDALFEERQDWGQLTSPQWDA